MTEPVRRLVIIGAGLAGLRAAQAARSAGFDGELTVIGEEAEHPYTRPPLSKEMLAGERTPEECALPWAKVDAKWRLGLGAEALDRTFKHVLLADGERVPYDRAIIATGTRARPWPGAGADLPGVLTLRTIKDSLTLQEAMRRTDRLVIVGAGFIGCEVAATARTSGVEVTLVDIADHPMLPLGPQLGELCASIHREHGVDLRCDTGLEAIHGSGRLEAVELTDGSHIETDTLLVALGALPNTEWLSDSGLLNDAGIECDVTLTAVGDPDVLVAGDVAAHPHPIAGGVPIRIEHWTTASEHGQLAGANALLEPADRAPHTAAPYFWSDQYDVKIQAVGFAGLAERMEIIETTPDRDRFVAVGERDGRLVAAIAFNAARRLMFYRGAIEEAPAIDDLRAAVRADEKSLGEPDPVGGGR